MIRATLIMRAWFDEVTKARNELPPPPPHFQRAPVVLALDRVAARWSDTDAFLLKALVIHKWSQLALRTRESDAHAAVAVGSSRGVSWRLPRGSPGGGPKSGGRVGLLRGGAQGD